MMELMDWSYPTHYLILFFLLGYTLGSIPFGLLITRFAMQLDVQSYGSGNIGATNVLRVGGETLGAITLICDALKATVAILIAWSLVHTMNPLPVFITAFGTMIGHIFPVWLKFKGGKGVAPLLGILIGLHWPAALLFACVWICLLALTRIASVASLCASFSIPFLLYATVTLPLAAFSVLLTILVWMTHYQNIARLLAGTESRIFTKSKETDGDK